MSALTRSAALVAALAIALSGCVIIVDKDGSDGETGVSIGSWDDYEDEVDERLDD